VRNILQWHNRIRQTPEEQSDLKTLLGKAAFVITIVFKFSPMSCTEEKIKRCSIKSVRNTIFLFELNIKGHTLTVGFHIMELSQ
jgi:hypothetical protein